MSALILASLKHCEGHLDFTRRPPRVGQVSKERSPFLPSRYSHSGQGDRARRGTKEGSQTCQHPCSQLSCCHGTDRPCITANQNLIHIFCSNAGPQALSGHSLGQPSFTVLWTSNMAETIWPAKIFISIQQGKENPTCK